MKNIYIPIHSFVDLITNSSSEVFVSDTEKTVEALKEAVNAILKLAKSDKTCDDLFDTQLCYSNGCDISRVVERFQDDIEGLNFKNKYTDEEFLSKVEGNTNYIDGALEVYKSLKDDKWGYYLAKDIPAGSVAGLFIDSFADNYNEGRPIEKSAVLIPKINSPEIAEVAKAFGKITGTVDAQEYYN